MPILKTDHIVTAYAERASGPGFANCPLWVIVKGVDGALREECLQPEEQTPDMVLLYSISEIVHMTMRRAVLLRSAKR